MISTLVAAGGGALGAVVGSYVTTAALRITDEAAPTGPRSLCDGCRRPLAWPEALPVVSYAVLRGRCRSCANPISPFHPIGEGVGLMLGVVIVLAAPDFRAVLLSIMGAALLAISVIDARIRGIPDRLTAVVAMSASALGATHGLEAWLLGLAAAGVCLGLLGGLSWFYLRQRGRVGIGLGDVELYAALALWLGAATAPMIAIANAIAVLIAIVLRPADRRIIMGPVIAATGFGMGLLYEAGLWPGL